MLDAGDLFAIRLPAYLLELSDGPGNRLTLIVEEATGLGDLEGSSANLIGDEVGSIFEGARRIVPGRGDRQIEITFHKCVGYSVLDESYAVPEKQARPFDGKAVRLLDDSFFRDYIKSATWASDEHPGKLTHYQIATENHCIDIISDIPPDVRLISVQA